MELSFETRNVTYLCRVLSETRGQEETAEVIVPDSCPDVDQVIFTTAAAILRSKECRAGSVVVSGSVKAAAICRPEDGSGPRVLEAYIPFSIRVEHPAAAEDLQARVCCYVRQADARLVNSRKVLFRANVGCHVEGYLPQELEICSLKQKPQALQVKTQTYPLQLPALTAEKSFVASDELETANLGGAERVIAMEVTPLVADCKTVGSRAVFKGNLQLRLLVQNQEGGFAALEQKLPFSQYCDLGQDCDEQEAQVTLCVTGAEAEVEGGSGRVLVSVGLAAQCLVMQVTQLPVIQDAYAIGASLEPVWKTYQLDCTLDEKAQKEPLRAQTEAQAAEVIFTQAYVDAPTQRRTEGGGLVISAPVQWKALYVDKEGQLMGAVEKTEVSTQTVLAENGACSAQATVSEMAASAGAGAMELRGTVCFQLSCTAHQELRSLCGGKLEPVGQTAGERPSVILRPSRRSQPVWDLAKEYATTVEAITKANALTGDTVEAGQMLLIPM